MNNDTGDGAVKMSPNVQETPGRYIAFVALNGSFSGQVNVLDFFRYAMNKGWIPSARRPAHERQ